ncbi:MAG: AIR synthase family protein [Acetatifactor sp.]
MRIGKISDSVLKRSILSQIKTKRPEVVSGAGIGEDCAIFAVSDTCACAVSQGSAATEEDMARILIKCTNNLAASGARPTAILLTLLLPQDTEESQLKRLTAAAEDTCARLEIQIAGGHTTVSSHVDVPIACVTGWGIPIKGVSLQTTQGAKPGQDIILTKWIALEGTAILARQNRQRLAERYPMRLIEEAETFDRFLSVIPEAASAAQSGIRVMHDASEGGILTALWELAESSGVGLTIDLRRIPIRQETVEICEFCGINPYTLASSGCLILTADQGEILVRNLKEQGIPATIIGQITDSNDRLICNAEEKRYLDKPPQDEIYKCLNSNQ